MIRSTQQTLFRLSNLNAQQEKLSYQMSTNKKLQYGSDDADTYTREVYINDKIKMYEGIKLQIEKTDAQNNGADSALAEAKNLISYVKTEVLKALNDTTDDTSKITIATNLKGVKENLLMLGNEQIEGEYIFAGLDSSIKPFEMNETTGKVTYVGDNELRKTVVEDGSYRDRGVNGNESFLRLNSFAFAGEVLTFSKDDIIVDQDGNTWERHRLVNPGESLTFAGGTIVDGNNTVWTMNSSAGQLEDGNGGIIPVSSAGGFHTISSIPSSTNGLAYNQLRRYDENDNLLPNYYLDISGEYPDNLNVTLPSAEGTKFESKTSVFTVLDNIINALEKVDSNGNAISDDEAKSELKDGLTAISNSYEAMNVGHAKLGARNKVFDISLERVSTKLTQYNVLSADVSSADLTKVAVEAKALELTYTSLYSTINRMNELSLTNFLR